MRPDLRHQLIVLDRALLALLDERARLLEDLPAGAPARRPGLEDLLRRHAGPFDPEVLPALLELVDRGCRPVPGGGAEG